MFIAEHGLNNREPEIRLTILNFKYFPSQGQIEALNLGNEIGGFKIKGEML